MYDSKLKSRETDALFQAILSLKDEEECYRFFEDLCTINEIKSLSQRMEVASLLQQGLTYTAIEDRGFHGNHFQSQPLLSVWCPGLPAGAGQTGEEQGETGLRAVLPGACCKTGNPFPA